jgi:hypothetical protein
MRTLSFSSPINSISHHEFNERDPLETHHLCNTKECTFNEFSGVFYNYIEERRISFFNFLFRIVHTHLLGIIAIIVQTDYYK